MLRKLLPKPTDIFGSIQPIYQFGHVLGLWCFKLIKIDSDVSTSKVTVYSATRYVVQFCVVSILSIYTSLPYYSQKCVFDTHFLLWCNCYQIQIWMGVSVGAVCVNLLLSKKVASILNVIDSLDSEMKTVQIHIEHVYVKVEQIRVERINSLI